METVVGRTLKEFPPRDAIHVAIAPVMAGCRLHPGQHIGFNPYSNTVNTVISDCNLKIGIVDPFLKETIEPGTIFWMFLYPNTITSLKHLWTHPAFSQEEDKVEAVYAKPSEKITSEQWIKNYAEQLDVGYKDLINAATEWLEYEEYMVRGGLLEGIQTSYEFWDHFEKVTGISVPGDKRTNFFSCSC